MKHLAALLLLCLFMFAISTRAQTSAFTFQGRLNDGGTPANGLYDFQFWLFDSLADGTGNQIGTQLAPGIQVTNGVFSVTLDFGSAAFTGADRYIQVVVRPSVNDPTVIYTILSPRQQLTSMPYSLRSLSAANAEQLAGVSASQYVMTGDVRLSDSRTPTPGSPDYIQNSTLTQPTSNFSISGTGKASTFDASTQYNLGGNRVFAISSTGNTFAGQGTGPTISTGNRDSFFGFQAGMATTTGDLNSFFGYGAGQTNTIGRFNDFFGDSSGTFNTTGSFNSFFGSQSGNQNTSGSSNTFLGNYAGQTNTTGNNNTIIGFQSNVLSTGLNNAAAIGAYSRVDASNSLILGGISGVNGCTVANNCSDTNVGIGTTTPSARLHVIGDGIFTGNLTVSGALNANLSLNTVNAITQYNINGTRVLGNPGSNNFFAGQGAGAANSTGASNAFFGANAGQNNDVGTSNSFLGTSAGRLNTSGSFNAFFGTASGSSNVDGNNNAFFGYTSGKSNSSGFNNSFFGNAAGFNTTLGGNNTFSGFFAGSNTTTGPQNTFFGASTGATNTTGGYNTLLGYGSDVGSAALSNATAVGAQATVSQSNSLVLGSINGVNNAIADTNVGIGTTAPSTRLHVVGDGLFTGNLTVKGSLNANISLSTVNATQYNLGGSQIIGGNGDPGVGNFFAGFRSGQSLTNGTYNSFFGIEAGKATDSGSRNSFFGYQAGMSNAGSTGGGFLGHDNSYFGYTAGLRCNGSGNSFFGQGAGLGSGSPPPNDCTGSNNSFFGQNAGTSLSNGNQNTAVGQDAGSGLNSGSNNSFLGFGAGASTNTGSNNVFVGQSSGGFNSSGSANTAIGSLAWIGSNNLTNATAIGANSCVTASDSLVLGGITNCGNPNGRDTNVGIGTSAPSARLHVVGDGLFTGNLTVNGTITGNVNIGPGNANYIQNSTTQQVSSNFNISGDGIIAGNAIIGLNNIQPLTQARLQIFDNNGSIQFGGTCNSGANAVGFASTFTCANYSLQGNGTDTMVNRAAGGNLYFREANTNEMTIIPGGNVGIGTTSPTTKLHVIGDGLFTGNLSVSGALNASSQFDIGANRVLSVSGPQNTNTFVGVQAGNANPTGGFNSFFGNASGTSATTGVNNSFFGSGTGNQVSDGADNSFFGTNAGLVDTASQNSFFGSSAGTANVDGRFNSFFGYRAGASNIGRDPGPFGSGQGGINAFFGAYAGENNTYGDNNAFFGYGAGQTNTTGGFNTFIGVDAGFSNINGNVNTFLGVGAGGSISTGGGNTIVGGRAGQNFTSGDYNSFFGADIFIPSTSIVGNNVTLLGGRTRLDATASNATAVGAYATVTQDNSLVLGAINGVNGCDVNNKCGDTNVGIGTTAPNHKLEIVDPSNTGLRVQTNAAGGTAASFGSNGVFQVDAPGTAGGRLHISENGNVGIGTNVPGTKLVVNGGGIFVTNPNTLIITSPNGACWGITVNNSGALSTFSTPCPQ